MSETDISICSRALVYLGSEPISSFVDEVDTAVICANVYPGLKTSLMGEYNWRHLMKKRTLTRDATAPIGEWSYSYIIPGEALSLPNAIFSNSNSTIPEHEFEIFQRRVFTNHETILMDYVVSRPESEWPAYFVELVVYALCANIAYAVTDQASVADRWERKAFGTPAEGGSGGAMGKAMTLDAQSSGNVGLNSSAFVDARFGGSY